MHHVFYCVLVQGSQMCISYSSIVFAILCEFSHTDFLLLHCGFVFLQSFNSLLHKLNKYVPRGSTVVDLYSGAGVIGLSVAASRKCR